MKRVKRIYFQALGFVLVLGIGAGAASCGGGKKGDGGGKASTSLFKKAVQKTEGVTTYVVTAREAPLTITEDGKTEASDRYQAKAPGNVKIEKIFVEEGARVQPGDPLVKFNDETIALKLAVAQAEIKEAEAGLAAFGNGSNPPPREPPPPSTGEEGANAEGAPPSTASPTVTPENLNESRTNLYQAQLDRAKAEVDLYEKESDLQQLNSPIAGVVGPHQVSEGASASEDQVMLEIVKLDPLDFTFQISSNEVSYLEKGSEIVVKLASFSGQEFPAEVASVGSEANSGNGRIAVKLQIANPDLNLKGDLKGSVEVRTTARRKVVAVPEAAVVKTEHSAYLYKLAGNKTQRVAVDLGISNGGQVEIEKGIAEGDTIIISAEDGMEALSDGATVEVQSTKAEK
jgi:RND family efflux transporter MFP subunit